MRRACRRHAARPVPGPGQRRDDGPAGHTANRPAADRTRRHTGTKVWRVAVELLADPRVRLGAGAAGVLITAHAARVGTVGPGEARAFRAVNGLPDSLYPPLWLIMQFGALGAVPAVAGGAWLAGDRRLAARLLADGSATWALAKLVKRNVQRPRPAMLLAGAHGRGRPPAGLGYLSGHACVATALGAATLAAPQPRLPRRDPRDHVSGRPVPHLRRRPPAPRHRGRHRTRHRRRRRRRAAHRAG